MWANGKVEVRVGEWQRWMTREEKERTWGTIIMRDALSLSLSSRPSAPSAGKAAEAAIYSYLYVLVVVVVVVGSYTRSGGSCSSSSMESSRSSTPPPSLVNYNSLCPQ